MKINKYVLALVASISVNSFHYMHAANCKVAISYSDSDNLYEVFPSASDIQEVDTSLLGSFKNIVGGAIIGGWNGLISGIPVIIICFFLGVDSGKFYIAIPLAGAGVHATGAFLDSFVRNNSISKSFIRIFDNAVGGAIQGAAAGLILDIPIAVIFELFLGIEVGSLLKGFSIYNIIVAIGAALGTIDALARDDVRIKVQLSNS